MVHNTPSTFTILDNKEHAWKKRILSQKLSDTAIRSFEPKIVELIDRFCEALRPKPSEQDNPWSEPFNMSHWCKKEHDAPFSFSPFLYVNRLSTNSRL